MLKFDEFKRYITHIKQEIRHIQSLNDVCYSYNAIDTKFGYTILIDDAIELLELLLKDEQGWIEYWVNDLDFGEKYKEGCVKINNKNVPLKTIKDLWNILNDLY